MSKTVGQKGRNPYVDYNACDLCAGAGGLSSGFDQAGFAVTCAVEMDSAAAETYRHNHPQTIMIEGDMSDDGIKQQVYRNHESQKCDVVAGGLPCPPFSRQKREVSLSDPRLYLWKDYMKIVARLLPRAFVIENVPRFVDPKYNRGVYEMLKQKAHELGYSCLHCCPNAADYGVPQNRERVIVVGLRQELGPCPFPAHRGNSLTVYQATQDLMEIPEGQLPNHVFEQVRKASRIAGIRQARWGEGPYRFRSANVRPWPHRPAPTVVAAHGGIFIHWLHDRLMSLREMARIQGFDDGYEFLGNREAVRKQIGGAVPPPMGQIVAQALIPVLCSIRFHDEYGIRLMIANGGN